MSEYQYYEFCRISTPLSQEARREMSSLSSRAHIGTHGASYVYNYGDFRGDPEKLVLKYFDIFFYISNFGTVRLMFKYPVKKINFDEIKKYCLNDSVCAKMQDENILLEICINNEEGFGWTEGEGLLVELIPLYDEIKSGNYQFLQLALAIHDELTDKTENAVSKQIAETQLLSEAQETFLECVGVEYEGI
jgi:hypothetical protein